MRWELDYPHRSRQSQEVSRPEGGTTDDEAVGVEGQHS